MAPLIKQNRSVFSGLVAVTLAVIITVSAVAALMNGVCQRNFWDAQAVYPGAQRIAEELVFLGIQRVVFHSPDAPAEVERWVTTQDAVRMREGVVSGDFSSTTRQSWLVEPDAERGGSLISAQTTCP